VTVVIIVIIIVTVSVLLAGGVFWALLCAVAQAERPEHRPGLTLARRQQIDQATFRAIRLVQARYQAAADVALRQAVAQQMRANEPRAENTDKRP
jgi:hypothetical protein